MISEKYKPVSDSTSALHKPELMAPAGDRTMLITAINAGADAVYFGVEKLNMRAKAANFLLEELPEIVCICKDANVKAYLTLNTILFEDELNEAEQIILRAKEAGVDSIICWDLAAAELCSRHSIPFCISTQGSVSNSLSAEVYMKLGAKRIVLARECTLDQIKQIKANTELEIEAFVHGAMCIAVSGRCFMSHHLFGISANRGECIQPCRREFILTDSVTNKDLVLGEDYVLSPKDLCMIEFIDQLIEAGIDSFKIEGRKRSPEYVRKTVSVYRRAIDLYFEGKLNDAIKKEMLRELEEVYNRGFSSGFYFGIPSSDDYAGIYGSKASTVKEYIGYVLNYYKKAKAVFIKMEAGELSVGDRIYIIGPTTGCVELVTANLLKDEDSISTALKGDEITLPCDEIVRTNDKVYLIKNTGRIS